MTDEERLLKEKYNGEKTEGFFADCERLKIGEPLAYVIGHIPFLNCTIFLDSKPLIPRPETEYWVEKAINHIQKTFQSIERVADANAHQTKGGPPQVCGGPPLVSVLDLCAGSGCIGVAVAKNIPNAHVTFGELNATHLPTIAKNLSENEISCTRYQVWQSDLFANISGTFDFILTNPPYIDPALDRTEPSVKDHEPAMALYGGTDGLEFIAAIIAGVRDFLNPSGQLWIEHEPEHIEAIGSLATQYGLGVTTHTDQYHVPRYSVCTMAQ